MDVNSDDDDFDDNSFLLRFQRSMSLDPDDYSSSKSSSTNSDVATKRRLVKSTVLSLVVGLIGWYYPRYLIAHETKIATKQVPYQEITTADGSNVVVLDFLLNNPLVDPPTIPSAVLVYTSVWIPLIIVTVYAWSFVYNKSTFFYWMELSTVISAFAMSIGVCEGTTQFLKLYIQRRRPNFYALCGFDTTLKQCTAPLSKLREANFSFPSGHSSLACGSMTFVVLYLIGKQCQQYNNNSNSRGRRTTGIQPKQVLHPQRKFFLTAAIPWGWAMFVAASRVVDCWHHPSDIIAGLGLGFCTVCLVYHTWYPPVWSKYAGIPRQLLYELDYHFYYSTTTTTTSGGGGGVIGGSSGSVGGAIKLSNL